MLDDTYLFRQADFLLFRLTGAPPRWNSRGRGRARLIASNSAAMVSTSKPKPSRVKVREHRERLRAQGLHPIQIWVPHVRAPSFPSEAQRQSLTAAATLMPARIRRSSMRCPVGIMNEAWRRRWPGLHGQTPTGRHRPTHARCSLRRSRASRRPINSPNSLRHRPCSRR